MVTVLYRQRHGFDVRIFTDESMVRRMCMYSEAKSVLKLT